MKCPLLKMAEITFSMRGEGIGDECLKEKCAWWNNTNGMCAILQLSKSVYYAGLYVPDLVAKMPHAGQFAK